MADDYSLDPLQTEEDILNEQSKRAAAMRLRAAPAAGDMYGQFMRSFTDVSSTVDDAKTDQRRRELAMQASALRNSSMEGLSPETQAMLRDPTMRAEGAKRAVVERTEQADAKEQRRIAKAVDAEFTGPTLGGEALGGPGSREYDYRKANLESQSSVGPTRARGEANVKAMGPHGPNASMAFNSRGEMVPITGANPALAGTTKAIEEAKYGFSDRPLQVEDENANKVWTTEHAQVAKAGGGPGATAPRQALPLSAPPVAPTSGPPATAPVSPATGQNPPPGPGAPIPSPEQTMRPVPGGMQIPPEVQQQRDSKRLQVLNEELRQEQMKAAQGDQTAINVNIPALTKEISAATRQLGAPSNAVVAGPGGQPPPPTPLGGAVAAQGGPPPPGAGPSAQKGPEAFLDPSQIIRAVGNNPQQAEYAKEQRQQQQLQMTKLAESNSAAPEVFLKLKQLEPLLTAPSYHGMVERGLGWAGNQLATALPFSSGKSSPEYRNTEDLEGKLSGLAAPLAKLLGVSPTDKDFQNTLKQFPGVDEDPATRMQKYQGILEQAKNRAEYITFAAKAVNQGYTVPHTQEAFLKYKMAQQQEQQQAPGNPTQAGGSPPAAPGGVLGNAVAAQGGPPASAGGVGGAFRGKPAQGSVGAFVRDPQSYVDMNRNAGVVAKNLNPATASPAFGEAAVDSAVNFARGAGGLLNIGGDANRQRGAAAAVQQEQKARQSEDYRVMRPFTDITANPTSYIGGASIPKIVGAAALQGATQLQPTQAQQFEAGGKSAAFGLGLGILSKMVPTGEVSQLVKRDMERFNTLNPASAQLTPGTYESRVAAALGANNAAASDAERALSRQLKTASGYPADKPLSNKNILEHEAKINKEFESSFPESPGATAAMSPQEQRNLRDRIDKAVASGVGQDQTIASREVHRLLTSGDAPTLSKLVTTLENAAKSGRAMKFNPADLHRAWREIGAVAQDGEAAGQVRKILGDVIEKSMPGKMAELAEANKAYSNWQDVKRIYQLGGGASGENAGNLAVSKIQAQAGKGPDSQVGGTADQAAEAINTLNLKNPQNAPIGGRESFWGDVKDFGRAVGGKVIHGLDFPQRIYNRKPRSFFTEKTVEALRRPQAYTSPLERQENENAP